MNSFYSLILNTILFISINQVFEARTSKVFSYFNLNEDKGDFVNGVEYKYLLDKDSNYARFLAKREIANDHVSFYDKEAMFKRSEQFSDTVVKFATTSNNQLLNSASNETPPGLCTYARIKSKVDECFSVNSFRTLTSNTCMDVLECISSLNLVKLCNQHGMFTPTIWILNVYDILLNRNFCNLPVECDTNDNEYLIKLNNIMKSAFEYGQAYLNQPFVDNKFYCSKSHNLVYNVRDLFYPLDQCFNSTVMNDVMFDIEESSGPILQPNCPYCISSNSIFDGCESNNFDIDYTCNISLKCIHDKIDMYKCNKDRDVTPLTLISGFMLNITEICNFESNDTTITSKMVIDWFKRLDGCLKDKRYMGLTFIEVPPYVDLCKEMDEVFKCMHETFHNNEIIKSRIKSNFVKFAHQFNRLQRTCELNNLVTSSSRARSESLPTVEVVTATRHPFQNNSEQTVLEDNKNYYHQTVIRAEIDQSINWVDLDSHKFLSIGIKVDDDLSKNYLKATIVKLKFKFPYYGHLLDQIVVATGGFIYVGSLMNPLITKAQYIAPLMANFDPTLNNRTVIKYVDNGTHFICTWENLVLQDQIELGEYTFQAVLNKDGDITFNYKKVPNLNISSINHTVKIGLSDAYIFYKILSTSKIEYTIVQYHVVNVLIENIKTGNSIMFFMLKNCLQLETCTDCLKGVGNFKCLWCPTLNRCSDTMDRYRQEWIESSCPVDIGSQTSAICNIASPKSSNSKFNSNSMANDNFGSGDYAKTIFFGLFLTILISMTLTTLGWAVYAYKNPTSPSGIWLIEHRPTRIARLIASRFKYDSSESSRFENPVA